MTAIALGERQRSLQPLRAALITNAQTKAQTIRAGAEADGREVLAAANAEADAVLATARAQGTADAEAALSLERAHDARAARGLLLAAQQRAYEKLRQQARAAVRSLLRDPIRRSQLADTLRYRLGAGATVNDHPDGGLVATGPNGRGTDASVHALVDVALAQLDLGAAMGTDLSNGHIIGEVTAGAGRIVRVSGPLVEVEGLGDVAMAELVGLGPLRLPAEVVAIRGTNVSVQAYEYTGGLAAGDPASALGRPLSAHLGPWLLGSVFDGLLRPLASAPTWLVPDADRRDTRATWAWQPSAEQGTTVTSGSQLGTIADAGAIDYRILVPPGVAGPLDHLAAPGSYRPDDPLATVAGIPITMGVDWPVRTPRPVRERVDTTQPLLTGQRVLDAIFPLARGSSAAVPGGFGTGKTMLLQQVAKWCDADVIVYVGCGERGNEMADVLAELGKLTDPRTGRRLAERTVIIANTSNMPMMARETSIYTGVTVAEHFRDMGYHAVVIADSTSRWAEALRELSSRSGALPAEEGYPASLASALAAFYERAGRVLTLGGEEGSVTIIGAVSPPGADMTEPVTALTQRFVRELWNLDRDLAYARHYPAVSWSGSFARDAELLGTWYAHNGDPDWPRRRATTASLLSEADRLGDLAELVGSGSLPGHERIVLLAGRLLREAVLAQSSLSENDTHCTAAKTAALIDAVLSVVEECDSLIQHGAAADQIEQLDFSPLLRAAQETRPDDAAGVTVRRDQVLATLAGLR